MAETMIEVIIVGMMIEIIIIDTMTETIVRKVVDALRVCIRNKETSSEIIQVIGTIM